jgi:hypothetical protein
MAQKDQNLAPMVLGKRAPFCHILWDRSTYQTASERPEGV